MTRNSSRRRFLSLASLATAGTVGLAGCGYRPGGGDVRWEANVGTGGYLPDDVLAADDAGTLFTVNRSSRGFDWDTEEWGQYADLAVYDAESGRERGETQTGPVTRPAVHGRTLYVGHEEGGLTAFGTDGETRWEVGTDRTPVELAASDDRVYAVTDAGDFQAFTPDDGERIWSAELDASGDESALAAADGAYVHRGATAASTEVTAFGPDGERRWSATLSADRIGDARPVLADDTLYVPTRGALFALDRESGDERWSHPDGNRGVPAVADGVVYTADGERVYALDAASGEERWRFRPEGWRARVSPPAAAEGVVYAGGQSALYALDGDDGGIRWRVDSEEVRGGPTVVGRTVVVVSEDGFLRGYWRE